MKKGNDQAGVRRKKMITLMVGMAILQKMVNSYHMKND